MKFLMLPLRMIVFAIIGCIALVLLMLELTKIIKLEKIV